MNEILFLASAVAIFTAVILIHKFTGKAGLFAWAAFAPVIANILTAKQITVFGLDVAMGTIMFASIFLGADIMNELYGKKEAQKAAWISFGAMILYTAIAQVALLFTPNSFDFIQPHFEQVFATSIRVSLASAFMFLIANLFDVMLFSKLKEKNKALWIRNNVSTVLSNCLENFLFVILAFYGTMPLSSCLMIALGTTVVEVITSLCDTPFVYLATKKGKE